MIFCVMPDASASEQAGIQRLLQKKTSIVRFLFQSILIFLCFYSYSTYAEEQLIIEPDAGRAPLYKAMQNARSSIQLVMYGLTDNTLLNSLIESQSAGKKLQVLLEKTPYKNETENDFAISKFNSGKIDWRPASGFQLTHQKTMLIDQRLAIVMTFNFTHSTFKNERNFALIIDDPNEVKEIEKVFTADWQKQQISVNHPNLIWSPDNSRQKLLDFLRTAQNEIKIYAQDISDYQTIGTLAKLARQGIKVEILLSKMNDRNSKKMNYLKKAGVNIHTCKKYYIHAKVIIIDKSAALLGSLNFTYPSINKNRELAVITRDTQVIKQLNQTFDEDFGNNLMPSINDSLAKLAKYMLRSSHHKHFSF